VGNEEDFVDGRRRIVTIGEATVGVFEHDGEIYAFHNACPHQGGPVCEGILVARVEEDIDEIGRVATPRFSDVTDLVCPWHGMEFDVQTGVAWSDPGRKLRKVTVVRRDGRVLIDV